jgi:hypothetical protein
MKPGTPALHSSRLLDQLRERIRYMHYSLSTEKVYVYWVRFFVRWSAQGGSMRHPRDMGAADVEMLDFHLPRLQDVNRPTRKPRIPNVLTQDEVA